MDDDGSKAKKRVLPQWMTEDKVDTKKPFSTNVKRKKYRSPRKSTVYCMNEKELVDYALEIINKSCDAEAPAPLCHESQTLPTSFHCSSNVSNPSSPLQQPVHDTELLYHMIKLERIEKKSKKEGGSEAETAIQEDKVESCKDGDEIPQTPSEGTRSPKLTPSPPKKLSNTNLPETLSDEEDDPLKYVREIFFS